VRRQLALAIDESERVRRGGVMAASDDAPARRIVAAFDFDGTITDRDSLVPFLVRAFGRVRVLAVFALLAIPAIAVLLRLHTIDDFKARVLRRLLAGERVDRLVAVAATHAGALVLWLRPQALQRIHWHREQGHLLVLVSSTIDLYLGQMTERLGFDHVLCSRLDTRWDTSGVYRFTGELAGADCAGPEKLRRLEALVGDLAAVELHAYGDSAGDRELLAAADHAHYRPFR
jgi:HAD superfamily hydrolase (TIGR01490 family)